MKPYQKITLLLLVAAITLNISCKKNDAINATDKTDKAALSSQIAMGFYKSLVNGVSTSANNGLKTNSTSTLKTMDAAHSCGESVRTVTNTTTILGDTTRTLVGNSIFTYLCNGAYSDNSTLDAYSLRDTLTSTDKGTAFKNYYTVSLNYDVKSTDKDYHGLNVAGVTSTIAYASKLSGATTTESQQIITNYTWNNIYAIRTMPGGGTTFQSGTIDFVMNIVMKNAGTPATGTATEYTGYLQFIPFTTAVYLIFHVKGGADEGYIVDYYTGKATVK
jgi:hypothetical protein